MHGGSSPRGVAAHLFKTGRRSKFLPTRLAAQYKEALIDPDLVTLRDELALVDVRLNELLTRVDTGESGAAWAQLVKTVRELNVAVRAGKASEMAEALNELDAAVARGASDRGAWNDVMRIVEQRRKLAESERRRLVDLQQMITAEQLMTYTGALLALVKENVTDKTILSNIGAGVRRLVSMPDRGRA